MLAKFTSLWDSGLEWTRILSLPEHFFNKLPVRRLMRAHQLASNLSGLLKLRFAGQFRCWCRQHAADSNESVRRPTVHVRRALRDLVSGSIKLPQTSHAANPSRICLSYATAESIYAAFGLLLEF